MDFASLSPRVNLEQSRKQAKDLLKAFKAGDPQVLDRIRWNHPRFRGLSDDQIRKGRFVLADAQLVIARLHYFDSWSGLLRHIETMARQDPRVGRFEDAADAIIAGDISKLESLLRAHADLVEQAPRVRTARRCSTTSPPMASRITGSSHPRTLSTLRACSSTRVPKWTLRVTRTAADGLRSDSSLRARRRGVRECGSR